MAQVQLKGKLLIGAVLTVKTGLHIGDSSDFAPIGAVDSPFIRDPLTKAPIIPGSSLKGKMRTLLAKVLDEKVEEDGKISLPKPEKDETVVCPFVWYQFRYRNAAGSFAVPRCFY